MRRPPSTDRLMTDFLTLISLTSPGLNEATLATKLCDTQIVLFRTSARHEVSAPQEGVQHFLSQLPPQRCTRHGGPCRLLQEIQPAHGRDIVAAIRHGHVQLLEHPDRIGAILK